MIVIGLVGGIASGKSFVAECFAELGAEVIDADQIGHQVLVIPAVVDEIRNQWPEVVDFNLCVDRKLLASVVFRSQNHNEQLLRLEKITHPRIAEIMEQSLLDFRERGALAVVLDAPVLIKAGWQRYCDKIVFVETELSDRNRRAAERGWTSDELSAREHSQTPLDIKRQQATDIVFNSHSKAETLRQVQTMWLQWGLELRTDLTNT